MKKIIISILAGLMITTSAMAEKEKTVKSKVNKVTVFLQGAQIHRKARFSVDKGVTKVVMEGMTQQFNKNSIQVKGKGSFIILDVSTNVFYPKPEVVEVPTDMPASVAKEIKQLEDSIHNVNWTLKECASDLEAFNSERSMLLTSGVIKGQTANDSILALKDAMDYMRLKLMELNKLILKTTRVQSDQQLMLNKMNTRLTELRNWNRNVGHTPVKNLPPVQQIIVTVSSDTPTSGSLEVSYMVQNAGWSPAYDLRADNISDPVKLTYKANVYQNTGVDWDKVKVKLSTINPNRSNTKPVLPPWYINYYQPIQATTGYYGKNSSMAKKDVMTDMAVPQMEMKEEEEALHISNFTQMTENLTMVEFDLAIPYSIESDGKNHLMAVASEEIDATFQHYMVPKLDKDAFLMAKLTGWEELNLLPAVANIYYDGTYVGQTRLNPSIMSDTMSLALGRDRGIYLTRKKISDDEKIRKLTNEKEKTVTYELALKNYKSGKVNLIIEDHIPVSLNEEIKVELADKGNASYNEKTGMLKWDVGIDSKQTQKYRFTYILKFDKDKTLALN